MQIPLQITMHGVAHSAALDAAITEKAAAFERFRAGVTRCHVTVSELSRHRRQGRGFDVSVELRAPGHADIVVSRQHDEDVYVAVRDAFDAALRRFEDMAARRREGARG
jgi:ribosomal subunit interface protein